MSRAWDAIAAALDLPDPDGARTARREQRRRAENVRLGHHPLGPDWRPPAPPPKRSERQVTYCSGVPLITGKI